MTLKAKEACTKVALGSMALSYINLSAFTSALFVIKLEGNIYIQETNKTKVYSTFLIHLIFDIFHQKLKSFILSSDTTVLTGSTIIFELNLVM